MKVALQSRSHTYTVIPVAALGQTDRSVAANQTYGPSDHHHQHSYPHDAVHVFMMVGETRVNPRRHEENMQTPHRKDLARPGFEPRAFLLWGDRANHWATMLPGGWMKGNKEGRMAGWMEESKEGWIWKEEGRDLHPGDQCSCLVLNQKLCNRFCNNEHILLL